MNLGPGNTDVKLITTRITELELCIMLLHIELEAPLISLYPPTDSHAEVCNFLTKVRFIIVQEYKIKNNQILRSFE